MSVADKLQVLVVDDTSVSRMLICDGLDQLGIKPTSKCGFILITGQADAHTIAQGKVLGMNNVLKKPFTVDGLKSCIQSIVGKL